MHRLTYVKKICNLCVVFFVLKGLLSFYGFPFLDSLAEATAGETPPLSDGFKFELHTLPVRTTPLYTDKFNLLLIFHSCD